MSPVTCKNIGVRNGSGSLILESKFDEGFDFAIEVVNKVLENLEDGATLEDFKESLEYELELMANDD